MGSAADEADRVRREMRRVVAPVTCRLDSASPPGQPSASGPPTRDATGSPAVPAPLVPMPAIVLTAVGLPGDDMGHPGRNLVITAGTPVGLDRTAPGNAAHDIGLVTVGTGFGAAEDVAERRGSPILTAGGRFPAGHVVQDIRDLGPGDLSPRSVPGSRGPGCGPTDHRHCPPSRRSPPRRERPRDR